MMRWVQGEIPIAIKLIVRLLSGYSLERSEKMHACGKCGRANPSRKAEFLNLMVCGIK